MSNEMLEISVLVLALQIGFSVALNYRGYNYNPLIPASHFMNYAPTRRLFHPHRYFPFASRRIPASDSDQSESEDLSLEETSFRLNSEHNHPYLRQKNRHRYNSAADNDASLEQLPIGRMGLNNFADFYRSAQTDRNRENFRVPNRRAPNNRFHRKADNDLSVENLTDDNKYSKYRKDLLKLNQLAKRLKQRQVIKSSKHQTKDNNDVSLENGPKDSVNPDDDSVHNLPALDAVSNIETTENRRLSFKNSVDSFLSPQTDFFESNRNREDFRRPYLRNRVSNRRAPNNKFHRKADNDLSVENLTDDNKYSKYREDLLKLNQLAKRLKQRQVTNKHQTKDNNDVSLENGPKDNFNPEDDSVHDLPALDAVSNVETSENRRLSFKNSVDFLSPHNDNRNLNLRKFSNLEAPNNRRNPKDSTKLANIKRLEMPSPNKDTPDAYIDSLLLISSDGKPDDITDARPLLRNSKVTNLEKDMNNYRKKFNRSDDYEDDLEAIINDRLSAPDDIDNKSVSGLANEDDFNFDLPELRQNNMRRTYDEVSFALSPNDRSNQGDDEAVENLPDLFVDSFDDLSLAPSGLRSNVLLDLQNSRKDNNAVDLELPLNDNLSAEEDNLSNLAILRLLSPDDLSLESSLLRRRELVKQNKKQFSRRRDDVELGLELLLTDKLSPDDHGVENLVPYHETHLRSSEPTHISLFEKQSNEDRTDNEDLPLESSLNNKLNHDDYSASDLSDLRSSSLNNLNLEPVRLRTREPLYLLNKQSTRRHEVHQRDPLYDAVDLFGLDKLENSEDPSPNLRQGENEASGNDSLLHLEYPWNGKMGPDDENIIISPLAANEKLVARQNQNLNESNYDLKLEYPWNDQLSPDKETTTKVPVRSGKSNHNFDSPNLRNINNKESRRSYYDPTLHMLPLTRRLHNEDASLLDHFNNNEFNDRKFLRYSDNIFDEARRTTEDDTEVTNSLEDPSSYITFPVDRRPNPRLRTRNNNEKKSRSGNRRANAPLATTSIRPDATEALPSAEVTTEKPTDIDTVVI